jgi:hypothetical protein
MNGSRLRRRLRPGAALGLVFMAVGLTAQEPPSEWTSEAARRLWAPMARAVQHVGVPGHQFQAGVLWDGALVFGPLDFLDADVIRKETAPLGHHRLHVSFAYGEPMTFVDRKGTNNPAIRRSLEAGRLPIPCVETQDGDLAWHETVFAHLWGRAVEPWPEPKADDVLLVHVLFKVRNTGAIRRTGHLWMHFGDAGQVHFGYKCEQAPEIGREMAYAFERPFGRTGEGVRFIVPEPGEGAIAWHPEVPLARGISGTPAKVLEWSVPLDPGRSAEFRILIPFKAVDPETAGLMAALESREKLAEVKEFWRKLESGPGRIVTPDPFFNDYLAAVAGQMAQQVARRTMTGGVWMYKTSPNHYEVYWPCNAAKALPVFDLRGMTWLNSRLLRSIVDMQTDDVGGLNRTSMGHGDVLAGEGFARIPGFMGNYGGWTANPLLISHGLNLWTLARHYRTTRDDAWLNGGPKSPLNAMLEGFDWVTRQRRRTMHETKGLKVPYWGLMPAASAHDWLAGNTIFNDAYCIAGMTEVVRLLREIGHPRAEETGRELGDYRRCLRDRYAEARDRARPLPIGDGRTIPYVPRMVQETDWAKPDWTYTGYSALRAGAWGVFDPRDELVDQALAFCEAGLPKGEGFYFAKAAQAGNADVNFAGVSDASAERHFLWRHYVEYETMWPIGGPLFLARDDLPRFFEWLFHNFAFAIHRDFRVGVESVDGVPSCAPGDGERWLTVRNMFLNEFGGYDGGGQSLWLFQAIPREWIRPGTQMSVAGMGTAFGGSADLALQTAVDGDSVTAEIKLKGLAVAPAEIKVRLRSGDGRPLRTAELDGRPVPVGPGDLVVLPAAKDGEHRIVGRFR